MSFLQYLGCAGFALVMLVVWGMWIYDTVRHTKQF